MKPVPAYRQPCFLPTPPTPDGDIYLAAPEPATAASTPPTSCADFASLAGGRPTGRPRLERIESYYRCRCRAFTPEMLTYRVSASAAAIRNATETNTANTTETANAADTGAAYRRSFAYFSGVNDAAFSVTETAGPWDGPAYWLNALLIIGGVSGQHTKNEVVRSAGVGKRASVQFSLLSEVRYKAPFRSLLCVCCTFYKYIEPLALDRASVGFCKALLGRVESLQLEHYNNGEHLPFSFTSKGERDRLYSLMREPNQATTWDGNVSAHMHHLMKALQSSRLLEVACQPRFPSLKTILLTKCPSLDWGNTAMSSSPQDSTPSRAGCRPRWSWKPTYTFLGLAVPQHLNKRQAPKRNQPSLFKKALLGPRNSSEIVMAQKQIWSAVKSILKRKDRSLRLSSGKEELPIKFRVIGLWNKSHRMLARLIGRLEVFRLASCSLSQTEHNGIYVVAPELLYFLEGLIKRFLQLARGLAQFILIYIPQLRKSKKRNPEREEKLTEEIRNEAPIDGIPEVRRRRDSSENRVQERIVAAVNAEDEESRDYKEREERAFAKEEVKWFSVDEAKTEASELQPFQVRESRIKVAARSVEERDTSNGKKGQPLRAAPFVKETKAYASNTSRSIEPDKQSNRLQIHTRSEVMAIEGKQIPGVEAPRGV
ncbi:hypothetical protein SO802_035404 [Lithocarpus litseifolius]|uniref:Uncharacterized protein n=1 Tax=Lithocarpus litseifolius TaxID=425828 RepID=A0AAW2B9L8_9ROSI